MELTFTPSQSKRFQSAFSHATARHKVALKKPRKNMLVIAYAINEFLRLGHSRVTSNMVREGLDRVYDLHKLWDTDPEAEDNNGITRAIGDIMGKHCLNLKRDKTWYVIPEGGITTKYIANLGYEIDV